MPGLGLALSFRDSIEDPSVIEELDRAYARLNAVLKGMGQLDGEKGIQSGGGSGVEITTFADLSGPLVLPVKEISLSTDTNALDPEDFTVLRVDPQAAVTIGGIKGGRSGRVLDLYVPDSAAFALTLADDLAAANADRRIQLVGAANLTSVPLEARGWTLRYDGKDNTWVQMGGSAVIAAAGVALDVDTTEFSFDTSTSETSVYKKTLLANTLAAGKILRLYVVGTLENATTNTYSIKVQLGSTVISSGAVIGGVGNLNASSLRIPVHMRVTIVALGASQQMAYVEIQVPNSTVAAAYTAAITKSAYAWNDSLTEDSTGTLDLDVLVTQSASDANNRFNRHSALILVD